MAVAMGMPNGMLGDIDIQKYGIQSVSMISEATWVPRILIKHLNGEEYSYSITREKIEDIRNNDFLNELLWIHIKKYCIRKVRKEKLERLNQLKFVDIEL